ncbi:F0F1 ATP synthase subunit B [Fusobacterium sp.]|uniref:F0F1 ATP synthase subunit B n=1 Tax=Fusobacterium sp. TaxID=68766 RepID=UPI0034C614FB
MPVISIDTTFFWQIINFFILLFIINKYFRKPIARIIAERKEKIERDMEEAKKNKKNAEELFKNAELAMNSSKKEALEIIKKAERKAFEEGDLIIQEAKTNREKIIRTTEAEVAKMKDDAKEALNDEVKKLAADLAEKIIKEKIDNVQETSLIDEFIAEVGEDK